MGSSSSQLKSELEQYKTLYWTSSMELNEVKRNLQQRDALLQEQTSMLEGYRRAYEISKGWLTPYQITYRHPTDEEFGAVLKLVKRLFPDFEYDAPKFRRWLCDDSSYVVTSDKQLIGCILVGMIDYTELSWHYSIYQTFSDLYKVELTGVKSIFSFGVLPEFRHQGIAQHLIELVLQDDPKLILETETTNLSAHKLYEKYGFRKIGILPHFYEYSGGDDGYLMAHGYHEPEQKSESV